jgi:hypothetical protein
MQPAKLGHGLGRLLVACSRAAGSHAGVELQQTIRRRFADCDIEKKGVDEEACFLLDIDRDFFVEADWSNCDNIETS